MRPFKDKVVLITGAGRGIGKRLAIGFAHAGARIGLLARSKAELDLAHLEIEHAGGLSLRLRADVGDFEQVSSAVEKLETQFGHVQILICAHATFGHLGALVDAPPREWAGAASTNLVGAMHACRAVLPRMTEHRQGKIVLLVGPGAEAPRPGFSAYAATQAALARFAETLAEEVRECNIQVNCMNPGPTYTSLTDEILLAGRRVSAKEALEATEVRTTGGTPPEKQVHLAQFLASDRSNHVSGKLIAISDDLRKLEHGNDHSERFTLRRLHKL